MYDPAANCHRLTGIGQTLLWMGDRFIEEDYYCVPSNKNLAVIGFPDEKTQVDLIAVHYEYLDWWFFTAEPKRDWRKLAVSIHMRCWNLAQYILGPIVETHLDFFTALALRKVREWKLGMKNHLKMLLGLLVCIYIVDIFLLVFHLILCRAVENRGFQEPHPKVSDRRESQSITRKSNTNSPIVQTFLPHTKSGALFWII